jgi:ribosome maturation factor RimP
MDFLPFYFLTLIRKEDIEVLSKRFLSETQFVVDISVSVSNDISIYVDDMNGITIDECRRISQAIEECLDREKEDYSLEVSSPGLTNPFRVKEQYLKNIGKQVEIVYVDGEKIVATLKAVSDNSITVETATVKKEANKKVVVTEQLDIDRINIKTVKSVIDFK